VYRCGPTSLDARFPSELARSSCGTKRARPNDNMRSRLTYTSTTSIKALGEADSTTAEPVSPSMRSLEGATLAGRYRVLEMIGSGGRGTVYEALAALTGPLVAVKALKRMPTAENLRRFRREVASATAIVHPHLCRVHYLGVEHDMPFIVMERLSGETLR